MKPGDRLILGTLARAVLYMAGLWVLGHVLILRLEQNDAWRIFGENGTLEVAQVVLLVVIGLLGVLLARGRPVSRPLSVLLAGFALAAIVREHNNWFKEVVGSGAWQAVVAAVLIPTLLIARRARGSVRGALADLIQRPAFGWLAAGLAIFVYGQVLDERPIWDLLLDNVVPYAAQRMAEECVETAAYWLLAAGFFEWWLTAPRGTADGPAS